MPDTKRITVKAAAVSVALLFGIATAAVPAYGEPTPSAPEPSSETGEHSHDHATTPTPPPAEGDHSEHTPPGGPTEPTEPTDRPRAWVFGGFAAINGVALAYAAWLRRRTAPDRNRRNAARAAAQAREGSTR